MTNADENGRTGRLNRRRFVQGAGVGGIGGLAGCLSNLPGIGGDDSDPDSDGAYFEVSDLDPTDATVEPGETIDVSATVANTGGEEGEQDVEVRVDGDALDTESLTLESDGEETVSFAVATDDLETGEYTHGVHSADDGQTGTLTVERMETELDPLLGDLTYEYYEDIGSDFPNFEDLEAVETGTPDDHLVSLSPREQDSEYGFVFEGQLEIGTVLDPGEYTFTLASDPGARLLVDDAAVVDSPDGPADESSPVQLDEGTHQLRLEYADADGGQTLALGWEDPYGELLPRISADDPLRTGDQFQFEVETRLRPATKRMDMPDSSVRSLSVGLYPNTNYCFDTTTATVQYGWRGAFLDSGPMIAYGEGRGNDPGEILGTQFSVGAVDYPLRFGDADAEPDVEFLGYRAWPYPPELRYSVDGREVAQTVDRASDGIGLEYAFEIDDPPAEPIYFLTAADADIEREASTGEWDDGVLEVPAGESTFSVTVLSNGGDLQ